MLALARIDVITGAEHLQHALDEIEAFGGADASQYAIETVLVSQPSEYASHRAADTRMLRQPGQAFDKGPFDTQHDDDLEFPPS